ncbi:MAG TPA: penicillin-binding transpeptidase domain-containing protein, partial [Acidimicrobiales bacterium]|nr:penicillin-binding transpeptidase domain-containing protein [Acidimicrobiales bacterium]
RRPPQPRRPGAPSGQRPPWASPRGGSAGRQGAAGAPNRPRVPRPQAPPRLDDPAEERARQRITSSPLRRVEEEEKELERRMEPVHTGLRLTLMGVVVLGLFAMMLARLWSLQVLEGPSAAKYEDQLSSRTIALSPPRGLIISRDGAVLVANKIMTVVTLNRQVAATTPAVIGRLSVALGVPVSQINLDIADEQDSVYEPVPVALGASSTEVEELTEHKSEFPGVTVSYVAERSYPDGNNAAQLLGYVSDITSAELKVLGKDGYLASDVVGQSGIEGEYEQWLHGKPGKVTLRVDALGDPVGTQDTVDPSAGDDIVLNIDEGLQNELQQALANQINTLRRDGKPGPKPSSAAAVVINPQNGAVYAMASAPTYNPAWWVGGISEAHYRQLTSNGSELNLVTQGEYIPGSTFKLATATAALDDGLISPYTLVNDPGHFTIPGKCSGVCTYINNDSESCGACDVTTALTMSDDVFFYTMGYDFWADPRQYGSDPIQKIASDYGFGQPSGVDLPGASTGQVDSPQLRVAQNAADPGAFPFTYYSPGDAIQTAFGQGETEVTPLQLANAYATFANGGTRYAPEVAAAIVSPDGHVVQMVTPKVEGHVPLPSATYNAIFSGLTGVITSSGANGGVQGTAYPAFVGYPYDRLPLFGKTGTATVSPNANVQPTAWFVACGPATGDTADPKFCAAVVIPYGGYGADAAAPVVRQVFQYLIAHPLPPLNLKPPANDG